MDLKKGRLASVAPQSSSVVITEFFGSCPSSKHKNKNAMKRMAIKTRVLMSAVNLLSADGQARSQFDWASQPTSITEGGKVANFVVRFRPSK